jgi:hypothetical protein
MWLWVALCLRKCAEILREVSTLRLRLFSFATIVCTVTDQIFFGRWWCTGGQFGRFFFSEHARIQFFSYYDLGILVHLLPFFFFLTGYFHFVCVCVCEEVLVLRSVLRLSRPN